MSKPVSRWTEKYEKNATNAVADYKAGVMNPRRDPIESAIAMRSSLEAKMANPETWDKWENSLATRGARKWRANTPTLGVKRYPDGIRAGLEDYKAFATEFKSHLDTKLEEIRTMPKATLEDSIARSEAMIRHNAGFKRSR